MIKTLVLDHIREVCQEVAQGAEFVRIDEAQLASYAASISDQDLVPPGIDAEHHYLGHGEDTVAYILTLEAINFGSGYFPFLKKTVDSSGYFTIASRLKTHFETRGPLPAEELACIDADRCARIFDQNRHHPVVRELLQQFSRSLNELGRHLLDQYDGSFTRLIEAADGSAENLVEVVVAMSRFDDVAFYRDLDVTFHKRAQLTAAALSLAFGGEGLGRLEGLDRLTLFADNLVPHVLRVDGILRYAPSLAEHIDSGQLIVPLSPEEIEIRACSIHAAELLVGELRRAGRQIAGHQVNALHLDQFLWNRGLGSQYRSLPAHRTRTIFY